MPGVIRSFGADDRGAVSSLYAIALLALIAIAGIAFDYGRLVAMHSELQNAADQAALAAATQLDGRSDAIERARNEAIQTFASATSEFVNETRISNDAAGRPVTLGPEDFTFYDGYADDEPGNVTTDGAEAKVVKVDVDGRGVVYALTPVVDAIYGEVGATAMATLKRAVCKIPNMMMCVPDVSFPSNADKGKTLVLHLGPNASGEWAPGNFGFLDIDFTTKANQNYSLGVNSVSTQCNADPAVTQPGSRYQPEGDALNTRLDIHDRKALACDISTGDFCPSQNVRTGRLRVERYSNVTNTDIACDPAHSSTEWITDPENKAGFPLDSCLATETCPRSFHGDGVWDWDSFMTYNHPGVSITTASPDKSRYGVHKWELQEPVTRMAPKKVRSEAVPTKNGRYDVANYCSYPEPFSTPVVPSETQRDRRVLTIAAVDCSNLRGRKPVSILRWVDVFLLQPATRVTIDDTVFATEIIGPVVPNFQNMNKDRAVLIR